MIAIAGVLLLIGDGWWMYVDGGGFATTANWIVATVVGMVGGLLVGVGVGQTLQ